MSYSLLGYDGDNNKITVYKDDRLQQMYVLGLSGYGKTTLLTNLILDDVKQGTGVCVIDPLGGLITSVLSHIPNERLASVVYLDISQEETPFGLNLYEAQGKSSLAIERSVDRVMHVWDRVFGIGQDKPLILDYMRVCAQTIIANPNYTMADIPLLLSNKSFRDKLLANVTDSDVHIFWQHFESRELPQSHRHEQVETVMRRIRNFTRPIVKNIVGQSHSTINFRELMDAEGKIVLVKLDTQLSEHTVLLGSMLIAEILKAAYSRGDISEDKRRQFHLYCDEFNEFATPDMQDLFNKARQYHVAVAVAHQNRAKLHEQFPELAQDVLGASTIVCLQLNPKDAQELAGKFDSTPPVSTETKREPIMTVKPDVLTHLRTHGHPNERVMEFTSTYLQKLTYESQKHSENPMAYRASRIENMVYPSVTFPEGDVYAFNPDEVRKHLQTLNEYLFNMMVRSGKVMPINAVEIMPNEMIKAFAGVLGFTHYYLGHAEPKRPEGIQAFRRMQGMVEPIKDLLRAWVSKDEQRRNEAYSAVNQYRTSKDQEREYIERELRTESGKMIAEDLIFQCYKDLPIGMQNEIWGNRLVSYRYEGGYFNDEDEGPNSYALVAGYAYKREEQRFKDFVLSLTMASMYLGQQPIMTESGQYKERPGQPQSSDEIRTQVANSLTHLGQFQARVRLKEPPPNLKTLVCHRCGKSVPAIRENVPGKTRYQPRKCEFCGVNRLPEVLITIKRSDDEKDEQGKPRFPQSPLEPRIKRVIENGLRQGYLRKREDIEEEIRRRQEPPDEPVPQPKKPNEPKEPPPMKPQNKIL